MYSFPPMPIIERVEIVPLADARRSVNERKPLLSDRHGDWFVMSCNTVSGGGNTVARLRLGIPVGGLPHAALVKLNGTYGVE